jgi:hypothetical protein
MVGLNLTTLAPLTWWCLQAFFMPLCSCLVNPRNGIDMYLKHRFEILTYKKCCSSKVYETSKKGDFIIQFQLWEPITLQPRLIFSYFFSLKVTKGTISLSPCLQVRCQSSALDIYFQKNAQRAVKFRPPLCQSLKKYCKIPTCQTSFIFCKNVKHPFKNP